MLQSPTATNPQQIVPYHKLGSLQPFVDSTPHFVSFAASEGSNGNDTQGRKKKKSCFIFNIAVVLQGHSWWPSSLHSTKCIPEVTQQATK